ncbi:glucan endo-1,3-beta-glucosidase 3 [Dioscorea cayenensis subsp. rotundata]|uniref:glucan endo-1,3-beta-D-glucosidase n=1 Tax=Dioscorea cayennensis subsp. rotundata TaxID=55577 RepID=A0AB40AWW4_DIOCR|nr:glucan endo-1,3-beta-glucosidase 3 [Dioscorea cayenensis subsp. rotundata]
MGRHLSIITLTALLLLFSFTSSEAGAVGVNYGRVANNLPSATKVAQLLKSHSISQIKLYDADPSVLRALSNSGIKVVVTLPNEQLYSASTRSSFALSWVQRNVAAYHPSTLIQAIAVGNEVFVDPRNLTSYLVPAMQNIHAALVLLHLDDTVKVSSPIALTALRSSYPPSAGAFRNDLIELVLHPMLDLIRQSQSYLMVNAYPFFAYEANTDVISLDYALFRPNPGVVDAGTNLRYYSLFDAQIDAVFAALSALKYDDIKVVVSETGWPSKGETNETGAGIDNAAAYNGNLVRRVLSGLAGTPLRPNLDLEVYVFALFNENMKPGPTSERNYGLFYPDEGKVYDIQFSGNGGSGNGNGGLRWVEDRGRSKGSNGSSGKVSQRTTGETWCVANGMVGKKRLQEALDYACGQGRADCKDIQPGAACYDPNTVEAHASFAFNSYYQKMGRGAGTCDFEGAAYVVSQVPKIGKCALPTRY